jgi:hypothetical protein
MDAHGWRSVDPVLPADVTLSQLEPWSKGSNFAPGYMKRGAGLLPKRGTAPEWTHTQDYWYEKDELPKLDFDSSSLRFE